MKPNGNGGKGSGLLLGLVERGLEEKVVISYDPSCVERNNCIGENLSLLVSVTKLHRRAYLWSTAPGLLYIARLFPAATLSIVLRCFVSPGTPAMFRRAAPDVSVSKMHIVLDNLTPYERFNY